MDEHELNQLMKDNFMDETVELALEQSSVAEEGSRVADERAVAKASELRKRFESLYQNGTARAKALCHQPHGRKILLGGATLVAAVVVGVLVHAMIAHLHDHDSSTLQLETAQQMQQRTLAASQAAAMNGMQQQLNRMELALQNSDQTAAITQLSTQMSSLSNSMSEVEENAIDAKRIAQLSVYSLHSYASRQKRQALLIETQIAAINKQLSPQGYLPVSSLPFSITGSSYWGSQLMLSVAIKDINGGDHYRLMAPGQTFTCHSLGWTTPNCTDWNLKSLAGTPPVAIFVDSHNSKRQVKVEL